MATEPSSTNNLPRPATTAAEVLRWPPVVLTDEQRREYFEHGCLCLPGFISADWIARLKEVVNDHLDMSRKLQVGCKTSMTSDDVLEKFVLAPDHSAEQPRVTRIQSPMAIHDTFFAFGTGPVADIAQDLLGPDVKYHHSKLNFKMGGDKVSKVQWHQDIQFWPHTNYTPLTIGVYLQDVTEDMGPMDVVPLSAYDELHPLEDAAGNFTGRLSTAVLRDVPLTRAVRMMGPAGTVTVHNARCVHGGQANRAANDRLLLLHTFAAATAHPLQFGSNALHRGSRLQFTMVRGRESRLAVFDPRPCPCAPLFDDNYKPPFFADEEEPPLLDG